MINQRRQPGTTLRGKHLPHNNGVIATGINLPDTAIQPGQRVGQQRTAGDCSKRIDALEAVREARHHAGKTHAILQLLLRQQIHRKYATGTDGRMHIKFAVNAN